MEKGECSSMSTQTVPDWLFNKALGEIALSQAEVEQAKKRIPKEYHDFLLLLEQKINLIKKPYSIQQEARKIGMMSYNESTYVSIVKPYITVDGRVQMARDEHKALGKRLDILAPQILTFKDKTVMTVEVVSEIYGSSTGMIELGTGGGVDKINPFANAQTSAIGRALGFLGYGLVGTGTIEQAEPAPKGNQSSQGKNELDKPPLSPSSKASKQYRVQILDIPTFEKDESSHVTVRLTDLSTKTLRFHKQHREFVETLKKEDVINFKGWISKEFMKIDMKMEPILEIKNKVS